MSCITMDTKTLLYNFFGSPYCEKEFYNDGVSIDILDKCAKTLANHLPEYFFYDISMKAIKRLIEEEPGRPKKFMLDEKDKIHYNGGNIDINRYNACYTKEVFESIPKIIDGFFKHKLYEKDIILLHPVRW